MNMVFLLNPKYSYNIVTHTGIHTYRHTLTCIHTYTHTWIHTYYSLVNLYINHNIYYILHVVSNTYINNNKHSEVCRVYYLLCNHFRYSNFHAFSLISVLSNETISPNLQTKWVFDFT